MPSDPVPPQPWAPQPWTPPPTHELTTADSRTLTYCLYGPADGVPVVSLPGAPSTRWERPDVVEAYERAGLRVLVRLWGFYLRDVSVPVGVWYGAADDRSPRTHAEWLLEHLPAAEGHEYAGGHEPDDAVSGRILAWLAGSAEEFE